MKRAAAVKEEPRSRGGALRSTQPHVTRPELIFQPKKVNRRVSAANIYQRQTDVAVGVAGSRSCTSLINADNKNCRDLLMLRNP